MKKLIALGIFVTVVFLSCEDRDDNLTTPNIRINNKTNITFNLLEFIPDSLFYENLTADGFSEYLEFETAFEAMPFTVETDSANFTYTPPEISFDPLPIGLYTYEVNINAEGEVELLFRID